LKDNGQIILRKIISAGWMEITEMSLEKILEFLKASTLWEKVVAGVAVVIIGGIVAPGWKKIINWWYKRKIYNWLKANTADEAEKQFKTTEEITKATGIDENQVRCVCKKHKKIYAHNRKQDTWSIFGSEEKSIYEKRLLIL
jgi:hypothetical protein